MPIAPTTVAGATAVTSQTLNRNQKNQKKQKYILNKNQKTN